MRCKKRRGYLWPLNKKRLGRAEWKQMEPQEDDGVVKGLSHRVIVVKSPDKRYFEEAIFIVRDDVFLGVGADRAAILREARQVAERYVRNLPGAVRKKKNFEWQ